MKNCAKCGQTKELTEFHKNSKAKDGCCSYCKTCAKATAAAWIAANPEKRQAIQRENRIKNREAINKRRRERREKRRRENYVELRKTERQGKRKYYLKFHYGLTEEDFLSKLEAQGNRCTLCANEFSESKKPVVDHCHTTGKVRDLLCSVCNLKLGHIEKDDFYKAALDYLEKHRSA